MSISCPYCHVTYLNLDNHACPELAARRVLEGISKRQIVIQLPDNPGPVYDDLLLALERLAATTAAVTQYNATKVNE